MRSWRHTRRCVRWGTGACRSRQCGCSRPERQRATCSFPASPQWCTDGWAALKAAVAAVRLGEHPVAVAVGSELVSRSFAAPDDLGDMPDTSFLRWTLSDGAGAVVVEPEPRPGGPSLRVDWMHLVSHAHDHPVCMSAGLGENREPRAGATWLDHCDPPHGGRPEVPALRQDMSALPALID